MLSIGILVSGGGTNLQAIIDKIENGYLAGCRIDTVVSSREGVFALERARKHGIEGTTISRKNFSSMEEYDHALLEHFAGHGVQLLVLAGFLSMLGEGLIKEYKNKIINVHPSLIPAFCGKGYYGLVPHKKALEYGVKITGATTHFVDLEYDTGPIILQKAVDIKKGDTPETLQRRVMEEAEWDILPESIKLFSEDRLLIDGRHVTVKSR